jgi:hypothetical protein
MIVVLILRVGFWFVCFFFQLQLGVDESYTLFVLKKDGKAIVGEATIEVNCGL